MAKEIRYHKSSHSIYHCNYHIVWTLKYRYRILIGFVADNLEEKIRAICELEVSRADRVKCTGRPCTYSMFDTTKDKCIKFYRNTKREDSDKDV